MHTGIYTADLQAGIYTADTAYGVSFVGETVPDGDWTELSPSHFRDSLKDLEDGKFIYARFGKDDFPILSVINEEYGIHE